MRLGALPEIRNRGIMTSINYRVFSDCLEENTTSYEMAIRLFNEFKKDFGAVRLIEEVYDEDLQEVVEENKIKSFGRIY